MGTKVRFKFARNVDRILGAQRDVHDIEHDAAEEALKVARDIAPVNTGAYRDSLDVDDNRLITTDPMGHLVEFGSINNPAYATLRNAANEVARKVVDTPR